MITAGMDFAFLFAEVNYNFFENVTEAFSSHALGKKFRFKFSTVDQYFKAIFKKQKEMNFEWPVYTNDFFPYNGYHVAHQWTGYFTSRPNFKKLVRDFTALTQISDTYYGFEIFQKLKKESNLSASFKTPHA